MKKQSVSITGATGFVGWHLCDAFGRAGWDVRAIVRPGNRKPLPGGVQVIEAPLEPEPLAAAIAPSELVIHSAAVIRAPTEQAFAIVNVEGTRAVVDAANAGGVRVIHLSSQAAGGPGTLERPRREDDPPQPVNGYGRSKLASEAVIREGCRVPWTILRPCSVYGPRDHGFLPLFQLARRGLSLLAMPASTPFSFVFIDDLVRAIQAAATDPRAVGETFFIGHPDAQRVEALGRVLAESFGRRYRPLRLPPMLVDAMVVAGEVGWKLGSQLTLDRGRLAEFRATGFVGSADLIRERLGFVATMPLAEGIAATARWYQENGWISR